MRPLDHPALWPPIPQPATGGDAPAPAAPVPGVPAAAIAAPAPLRPSLSVFDLSAVEQLLLWSARRWRHGRYRWPEVEGEFRRHLGAGWADALLPWEMALDLLHRRPLGQPEIRNGCDTALSLDEMLLLRLVALTRRGGVGTGWLAARLLPSQDREELAEWLGMVAAAVPALPVRCAGERPGLRPGSARLSRVGG